MCHIRLKLTGLDSIVGLSISELGSIRVLWAKRPRFDSRQKQHTQVQTGSEAHPASYPMEPETLSQGVKRMGHDANQPYSSITKAKSGKAILPLPYPFSYSSA
jgi:hypothetical protein